MCARLEGPISQFRQGYGPTGFDVLNCVKKLDPSEIVESGTIHMAGSILAFPFGCFLWDVASPGDVTLDSLAPVLLHRPMLDYLFIGSAQGQIAPYQLERIREGLVVKSPDHPPKPIVVESMSLANAMGTFNILNAEDRQVAVALIKDSASAE